MGNLGRVLNLKNPGTRVRFQVFKNTNFAKFVTFLDNLEQHMRSLLKAYNLSFQNMPLEFVYDL